MARSAPSWGDFPTLPEGANNGLQRSIPVWMDSQGNHGDVQFFLMRPTNAEKLPSNPFVIFKSVEKEIGKVEGANPLDGGKHYLIKVRSQSQADKLLSLKELNDKTPVTVEFHPTLNYCKCVVTCRDVAGMSEQELCHELASQGVTGVRRFTRRFEGKELATDSMTLTVKGTVPPTHIFFGYIRVRTRPYYPRPMLCFKCFKFGHTKQRCSNPEICSNCGSSPHEGCALQSQCVNCGGPHNASARSCPKFKEEQEIVKLRVDLNLSLADAKKEYQSRKKAVTYHETSKLSLRMLPSEEKDLLEHKNRRILQLEEQVARLAAEIAELRKTDESDDAETEDITDTSESTLCSSSMQSVADTDVSLPSVSQTATTPKRKIKVRSSSEEENKIKTPQLEKQKKKKNKTNLNDTVTPRQSGPSIDNVASNMTPNQRF